nr:hypothetical protein [Mycoplasmopsis bovis]
MSVSLIATELHLGHFVLIHSKFEVIGFPLLVKSTFSGNLTGKFSNFSGTIPHIEQWIIGIGAPQYLWRLIPQSCILIDWLDSNDDKSKLEW